MASYTARPRIYGPSVSCGVSVYSTDFAGTKLYCLVTEAHRCEKLAQSFYAVVPGRDSNPRLLVASPTLDRDATTPPVAIKACAHGKEVRNIIRRHGTYQEDYTVERSTLPGSHQHYNTRVLLSTNQDCGSSSLLPRDSNQDSLHHSMPLRSVYEVHSLPILDTFCRSQSYLEFPCTHVRLESVYMLNKVNIHTFDILKYLKLPVRTMTDWFTMVNSYSIPVCLICTRMRINNVGVIFHINMRQIIQIQIQQLFLLRPPTV